MNIIRVSVTYSIDVIHTIAIVTSMLTSLISILLKLPTLRWWYFRTRSQITRDRNLERGREIFENKGVRKWREKQNFHEKLEKWTICMFFDETTNWIIRWYKSNTNNKNFAQKTSRWFNCLVTQATIFFFRIILVNNLKKMKRLNDSIFNDSNYDFFFSYNFVE